MPIDETLAGRVRSVLDERVAWDEKRMFGGLAFLVNGHMACGILGDRLMVRVGPEAHESLSTRAHVSPMDFTGRPLRGFLFVEPAGTKTRRQLAAWMDRTLEFVGSLPSKT